MIPGDTFNGDNTALAKSIRALVELDDREALRRSLPWAAKVLLIAAANRLAPTPGGTHD